MRCLVIAGVFPPAGGGGALRLAKMLRHLPKLGCDVDVIAPRGRVGWFQDPGLLATVREIQVTRVGLPAWSPLERLRRSVKDPRSPASALGPLARIAKLARDRLFIPDELALWSLAAVRAARGLLERRRYQWLFTASFPYSAHLAGLALAGRHGTRWLADFADPWAGHAFRGLDAGLRRHLDAWLEGHVLDRADAVTVASPGMQRLLTERGWPRAHLLTNTWDAADFDGTYGAFGDYLLFTGSFDAQLTPPDPLLAGLRRARSLDARRAERLRLLALGGADLESAARIRAALPDLPEGAYRSGGFVAHADAVIAMRRARALLLSVAPGAHWHMTAKVIEYLASGRPIIAAVPPGDCMDLLQRCGGAAIFAPDDVEGIAAAMLAAADGSLVTPPLDRAALAPYESRAVAQRLLEIMRG